MAGRGRISRKTETVTNGLPTREPPRIAETVKESVPPPAKTQQKSSAEWDVEGESPPRPLRSNPVREDVKPTGTTGWNLEDEAPPGRNFNSEREDQKPRETRGGGGGGGWNLEDSQPPRSNYNSDREYSRPRESRGDYNSEDSRPRSNFSRPEMKCFNCDGPHRIAECPEPKKERRPFNQNGRSDRGSSFQERCSTCEGKGHTAAQCPTPLPGSDRGSYNRRENNEDRRFNDNKEDDSGFSRNNERSQFDDELKSSGERKESEKACHRCNEFGHRFDQCSMRIGYSDADQNSAPYNNIVEVTENDIVSRNNTGIQFDRYDSIQVTVTDAKDNVDQSYENKKIESFDSADLSIKLLEILRKLNYKKPTPVQKYAIPIIQNRMDMLACAQTGSGKTAAFVLPIVDILIKEDLQSPRAELQKPFVLILAPTRELVQQITKDTKTYCMRTTIAVKESYGGVAPFAQKKNIQMGCHILVGTTGRTKDFLSRGVVSLARLKFLVLDEADRMLDMGFQHDLREILDHPTLCKTVRLQTLMFSATFPIGVQDLVHEYLQPDYRKLNVGVTGTVNEDVHQIVREVPQREKRTELMRLLQEKLEGNGRSKILVFVETKKTADYIATLLSEKNMGATSMHGDRLQQQREEALGDFQHGRKPILVATSVAARGLDIRNVDYVINYDLPTDIEEYIHRVGRTGRLGNKGCAISYFDPGRDGPLLFDLQRALEESGQDIPDFLIGTNNNSGDRQDFS